MYKSFSCKFSRLQ